MDLFAANLVDQRMERFDRATEVGNAEIEKLDFVFQVRNALSVGDGRSQC
ncbi:MAG: hypothetical protein WCC01_12185 [Acidimicrobiia bacterium]